MYVDTLLLSVDTPEKDIVNVCWYVYTKTDMQPYNNFENN